MSAVGEHRGRPHIVSALSAESVSWTRVGRCTDGMSSLSEKGTDVSRTRTRCYASQDSRPHQEMGRGKGGPTRNAQLKGLKQESEQGSKRPRPGDDTRPPIGGKPPRSFEVLTAYGRPSGCLMTNPGKTQRRRCGETTWIVPRVLRGCFAVTWNVRAALIGKNSEIRLGGALGRPGTRKRLETGEGTRAGDSKRWEGETPPRKLSPGGLYSWHSGPSGVGHWEQIGVAE